MKTINATLSAAQKLPAGRPIARASLADNGRLHPAVLFSYANTGVAVHAVNCGTFFVRTRQTTGANTLDTQKITSPTTSSQWTTWTNLNNLVPLAGMSCLFWTGTYVVIVYQSNGDGKLYSRRSTDGVTWAAAVLVSAAPAPAYTCSLGGLSGGATTSGIAVQFNGTFYFCGYNANTDTWGALEDTGLDNSAVLNPSLCGFYDSTRTRHVIICTVLGAQPTYPFVFSIFAVTRTGPATFGTPIPYMHSNRQAYVGIAVSQTPINGLYWLTFGRQRPGSASSSQYLACSDDGVHWEDGYPLHEDNNPYLEVLPALSGDTTNYLANETTVLRSPVAPTYWSNLTVKTYQLTAGGEALAGQGTAGLNLTVDNRGGAATTPTINTRLTLERGYNVEGADYYVSAGVFYLRDFDYNERDQLLTVRAVDAWGLLEDWIADQAFSIRGARIDVILEHICALAGIHTISVDASTLWAETIPNFTIQPTTSGQGAVRLLQNRVPFDCVIQSDGSLYAFVPSASPAAVATFGPNNHKHWPGHYGAQAGPTWLAIAGSIAASIGADAYTESVLAAAGRRFTRVPPLAIRITDNAKATALANATLLRYAELSKSGAFHCPPDLAIEPGDVVTLNDSSYAAAAGPWRVVHIAEHYNTNKTRPYYQHVIVRGTA